MFQKVASIIHHCFNTVNPEWQKNSSRAIHGMLLIQEVFFNVLEGALAYQAAKAAIYEEEDATFKQGAVLSVFLFYWGAKTVQSLLLQKPPRLHLVIKTAAVAFPWVGVMSISSAQLIAASVITSKQFCDQFSNCRLIDPSENNLVQNCKMIVDQCLAVVNNLDNYYCGDPILSFKDLHYYMIRCETFEKNNDGFMQAEVNNLIEHRSKICTSSVYDCRFLIDKGGTTVYWNNQPSPQIRLNEQSIQSINAYYQNFHEMLDECSVRSANGDKVFNYLFINASVLFVATSITGVKLTQKLMKLFKNHPSTELN